MIPIIHKLVNELENNHVTAAYVIIISAGLIITGVLIWLTVMIIKKIIRHNKQRKITVNHKQKAEKSQTIIKSYKKIDLDDTGNLSL